MRSQIVCIQKKREYGERVREVELATFTLLFLAQLPPGGMGKEAMIFYCRLADRLSNQGSMSYRQQHFGCTLSFSLLRSATMCIRGTRSILYRNINASPEAGHTAGPRDFYSPFFQLSSTGMQLCWIFKIFNFFPGHEPGKKN